MPMFIILDIVISSFVHSFWLRTTFQKRTSHIFKMQQCTVHSRINLYTKTECKQCKGGNGWLPVISDQPLPISAQVQVWDVCLSVCLSVYVTVFFLHPNRPGTLPVLCHMIGLEASGVKIDLKWLQSKWKIDASNHLQALQRPLPTSWMFLLFLYKHPELNNDNVLFFFTKQRRIKQ